MRNTQELAGALELQTLPRSGPIDRFLEHAGACLRYRDEGAGPALVLVHGWALDLEMWEPQAAALSATHRIVRVDRRSFGASSGASSIDADALDILALLEQLAIDRCVVVGMSQGARVALALACLAPQRVAGLVLDGAPAVAGLLPAELEDESPVTGLQQVLREQGLANLRQAIARHPFMELRTRDVATRALLASILGRYRAADVAQPTLPATVIPRPGQLRLPVLVLNGMHDTAQRMAIGDAYVGVLPRAERARVPDAGHLPNLENPDEYNAILSRFVARHAGAAVD